MVASGRRLARGDTGQFFHQRCACQGAGAPGPLGCFRRCRGNLGRRGCRLGRLFRFHRLCFQRQDARDPVFVGIDPLLVLFDAEPNAHGLEKKDPGIVHLLGNVSGDAQIFKGLAADRLRLLAGMQVRDPLPNLPAFEFTFGDLPSQGQVVAVAGVRLLDAGLDNLGDVFTDRQHVPGITFLRRWVKGFRKLGSHESPRCVWVGFGLGLPSMAADGRGGRYGTSAP